MVASVTALQIGVGRRDRFGSGYEPWRREDQDDILRSFAGQPVREPPGFDSLVEAPLFATTNSPWSLKSAVELGGVIGPGTLTAISSHSTGGTVAATAAGIFITYVGIPTARGLGAGLEHSVKEWALKLAPTPPSPPRRRRRANPS